MFEIVIAVTKNSVKHFLFKNILKLNFLFLKSYFLL